MTSSSGSKAAFLAAFLAARVDRSWDIDHEGIGIGEMGLAGWSARFASFVLVGSAIAGNDIVLFEMRRDAVDVVGFVPLSRHLRQFDFQFELLCEI